MPPAVSYIPYYSCITFVHSSKTVDYHTRSSQSWFNPPPPNSLVVNEDTMKTILALAFATFATYCLAIPLNINLGAYSPALVVGDGAIGFNSESEAAAEGAAAA
ncbi:hypothetical protein F5Y07DRAFT_378032 [Xylaria sp. FL0933]|nr:hypothetical protein F5Y07DRAFT_378032 [Xylaria sp. FL0933]